MDRRPSPLTIALLGALYLGIIKVALAQPTQQGLSSHAAEDAAKFTDFSVPSDLGYTLKAEPATPSNQAPSRTIIHMQEAHANYEGQQHLAAMLERLIQQYGVSLILVEGGHGDVSVRYLRAYGSAEKRKSVADEYLKSGLIGGEEYLDITSDYPLQLWGVEDRGLYDTNVRLFFEVNALQPSLKRSLAAVRATLEELKPRVYSPALLRLETQMSDFAQQRLPLSGYAQALLQLAREAGIPTDDAPHLTHVGRAAGLEQAIHREKLPKEQTLLMANLSRVIHADQFDRLIEQAKHMKAGGLTRESFYSQLETAIAGAKIDLASYPNLSAYLRYLKELSAVDPAALSKELEAVSHRLRAALASTPEAQTVVKIAEQLELVEKFVDLKLSPEEYGQMAALAEQRFTFAWPTALNELLKAQGIAARSYEGLDRLDAALPTLQQFYRVTQARDQVLADNALAKLDEAKASTAVLITGGFHGPQIDQRLSAAGVGVVVVVPRLTQATDDRLYEAVLRYKSGFASKAEVDEAVKK